MRKRTACSASRSQDQRPLVEMTSHRTSSRSQLMISRSRIRIRIRTSSRKIQRLRTTSRRLIHRSYRIQPRLMINRPRSRIQNNSSQLMPNLISHSRLELMTRRSRLQLTSSNSSQLTKRALTRPLPLRLALRLSRRTRTLRTPKRERLATRRRRQRVRKEKRRTTKAWRQRSLPPREKLQLELSTE